MLNGRNFELHEVGDDEVVKKTIVQMGIIHEILVMVNVDQYQFQSLRKSRLQPQLLLQLLLQSFLVKSVQLRVQNIRLKLMRLIYGLVRGEL